MNAPLTADHNQLVARAAKSSLAPLGCRQKGRSRLWYLDQAWWLAVIEFQPSAWGKGSYLNAGAMWLWCAKSHWSFDEGGRVEGFHAFKGEQQFSSAADRLAANAVGQVVALKQKFPSIGAVATHMEGKAKVGIWDHYHAAISSALAGRPEYALSQFKEVSKAPVHAPWVNELQVKAAAFAEVASRVELLRHAVAQEVHAARALLKIQPANVNLWA
jgi:hypothetical protein